MAEKNLYKIAKVQRAAASYVSNNNYYFTSSVIEMLKILNGQALEYRRMQSSLIMLYKINYGLAAVDHHRLTKTRNLNFFVPYFGIQYHVNSFFPGTIRYWNSLPYSLKASTTVSSQLDWTLSYFINQIILCLNSNKCRSFKLLLHSRSYMSYPHSFSPFLSCFSMKRPSHSQKLYVGSKK